MRIPCLLVSTVAAAPPSLAVAAGEATTTSVGLPQLGQVLGALALVLLLIFGLGVASQRLRLGRGANGRHLRIVDALALGARERLLLVDVAGERVLLGVAGGRIERLHVVAPDRDPDHAVPAAFPAALDAAVGAREAAP